MPTETNTQDNATEQSESIQFTGQYAAQCWKAFNFGVTVLGLSDRESEIIARALSCDLGRLAKVDPEITLGKVSKKKDGSTINIKAVFALKKERLTYALAVYKAIHLLEECKELGVNMLTGKAGENLSDWLQSKIESKGE